MATTTFSIDYLNEDEVEVECRIRKINVTTDDYKQVLNEILKKEATDPSLRPLLTHATDFIKELKSCVEQQRDIAKLFDQESDKDLSIDVLHKLETRVEHWTNRTFRLKGVFHQDNDVDKAINAWRRINNRIKDLKEARTKIIPSTIPNIPTVSTDQNPINVKCQVDDEAKELLNSTLKVIDSHIGSAGVTWTTQRPISTHFNTGYQPYFPPSIRPPQNLGTAFPDPPIIDSNLAAHGVDDQPQSYLNYAYNSKPYSFNPFHRFEPKWNLYFHGTNQGLNVHDFVFRMESFANRDRIALAELDAILPRLLRDTAEKWYWIYVRKCPNSTYIQTRHALLKRFSGDDSDKEIRKLIETRRQRFREPFSEFLLDVESYNGRLNYPFSEMELVDLIRGNMDPALQNATLILNFTSTEDLRRVCQRFEKLWARTRNNNYPSQNTFKPRTNVINEISSPLEEDFFAHSVYNSNDSERSELLEEFSNSPLVEAIHPKPRKSISMSSEQPNSSKTELLKCWNCAKSGHSYHDCIQPFRRVFCFGCGRDGFRKPICPNCTLNAKTSERGVGPSRSNKMVTWNESTQTNEPNNRI